MVDTIRTVIVLGSSGTIGSLAAGLVAQSGTKVYFLSRTEENAKSGVSRAIAKARSEVIAQHIECGDYDRLLKSALEEADWIIEAVREDLAIKQGMYERIDGYKRPDAIVSSTTSSLPLTELAAGRSDDFKRNFMATHFYNPPGKMLACEIAAQADTDEEVFHLVRDFLEHKLRRVVIPVRNVAGFAGNRIAFLLLNRIAALAVEYGVEMMDYLIGPYTGRLMPPLATLDLVGLDIYKEIIGSLYAHTDDEMHDGFVLPDYVSEITRKGLLGNKTQAAGGFYKKLDGDKYVFLDPSTCDYVPAIKPHFAFVEKAKHMIHMGLYQDAFGVIKTASSKEADIVMDILCTYITYSYGRIGEVTERDSGIGGIDAVLSYGFNWAPPSLIVKVLGGGACVKELLEERGFAVPESLKDGGVSADRICGSGRYFLAR